MRGQEIVFVTAKVREGRQVTVWVGEKELIGRVRTWKRIMINTCTYVNMPIHIIHPTANTPKKKKKNPPTKHRVLPHTHIHSDNAQTHTYTHTHACNHNQTTRNNNYKDIIEKHPDTI